MRRFNDRTTHKRTLAFDENSGRATNTATVALLVHLLDGKFGKTVPADD
jgi:hypothetical protein